jgi:hypothetical protein
MNKLTFVPGAFLAWGFHFPFAFQDVCLRPASIFLPFMPDLFLSVLFSFTFSVRLGFPSS